MKVVLIEDCLALRRLMVQRLELESGISVVGQADCESAAVATVALSHPDVVLVDLSITAGTGLSVISRIREGGFRGKVFVLSSEDRAVYGPQVMCRGADGFYDKAFDFEDLMGELSALSRRGWLSAA